MMPMLRVSGPTVASSLDHLPGFGGIYGSPVRKTKGDPQRAFYRTEHLDDLYKWIGEAASAAGWGTQFPYAEPDLDVASPERFYLRMREDIHSADAAVVVFSAGDVSTAVEATLAAEGGKRQLILYLHEKPPRLVVGQSRVENVAAVENRAQVIRDVTEFLKSTGGPLSGESEKWSWR